MQRGYGPEDEGRRDPARVSQPTGSETEYRRQDEVGPTTTETDELEGRREARRRGAGARSRYGGVNLFASFVGFVVALFFLAVFLGIVAAIVGTAGYQMGAKVPSLGSAAGATSTLGLGALAGSLVALFLAYLIGGYAAGRSARYAGTGNGFAVVVWTVVVAIILGVLGAIFGNRFNVADQLHLSINMHDLTVAGIVSLVVTLVVMLIGAVLGGALGGHYHRQIDREVGAPR